MAWAGAKAHRVVLFKKGVGGPANPGRPHNRPLSSLQLPLVLPALLPLPPLVLLAPLPTLLLTAPTLLLLTTRILLPPLPLVLLAKPLPTPLPLALLPPLLVRAQVTNPSPSMLTRTSASERPRALRRIAKVPSGEKGECNAVVPSHYLTEHSARPRVKKKDRQRVNVRRDKKNKELARVFLTNSFYAHQLFY